MTSPGRRVCGWSTALKWTSRRGRRPKRRMCEVRHLYDGVIRRERFERGVLASAEDLNADGVATRRLTYGNGKLLTREYWRPGEEGPVSREIFGADGFKTEEIRWWSGGEEEEDDHWYYDHSWPVKRYQWGGNAYHERRGDTWHTVRRGY